MAVIDSIPIIGAPVKVHGGLVMAFITCQCQKDNKVEVIRGHDMMIFCQVCKNLYQITKVSYDIKTGQGFNIEVSLKGKFNSPTENKGNN